MHRVCLLGLGLLAGCVEPERTVPVVIARSSSHQLDIAGKSDEELARELYEIAKGQMHRTEFQAAIDNLEKAYWLDPSSQEIRDLHREVSRILDRRPPDWGTRPWAAESKLEFQAEQTWIEIEMHLLKADLLFHDSRFEEAAVEFETAHCKLKWCDLDKDIEQRMDRLDEARFMQEQCLQKAAEQRALEFDRNSPFK